MQKDFFNSIDPKQTLSAPVGAGEQRGRHGEAKRLCGLEIDGQSKFAGLQSRTLSVRCGVLNEG
jgi:hypothetical protein